MGKEILKFGTIENEKSKFYRHKAPVFGGRCRYLKSIII